MDVSRFFILCGCALAGLGVMLGAFGAHALRKSVTPAMLAVYQTGVLYQFIHAIALIALGITVQLLMQRENNISLLTASGGFMFLGVVLFSGSLYLLALTSFRYIGIITPIGGVALIVGWFLFFTGVWRHF